MNRDKTHTLFCIALLWPIVSVFPVTADAAEELSFDEALKLTVSANPQAAAAARAMDAASYRVSYNKAGLFPRISADAAYSKLAAEPLPSSESYDYGVSLAQPLFSPALPAAVRSAGASYHKAEAEYDRVYISLLLNLRTVYADLWKARETIKLSEETLKRRADNVEIIRLKYEAGRESKAALLEMKAVYSAARWQHEGYKSDLRRFERRLNDLLNRPQDARILTAVPPDPPDPPEDLGPRRGALERHPLLRSAQAAVALAQASVDRASGALLPEANAKGKYFWSGKDWPDKDKSWSAGLSLSIPLFYSGKLRADLAASKADMSGAAASLADIRNTAFQNAEDALSAWRQAWLYMDVSRETREAADARAWLLRKQYLAGQASYFEWRSVEDQLIAAENQAISARRDLLAAYAAFMNSVGE